MNCPTCNSVCEIKITKPDNLKNPSREYIDCLTCKQNHPDNKFAGFHWVHLTEAEAVKDAYKSRVQASVESNKTPEPTPTYKDTTYGRIVHGIACSYVTYTGDLDPSEDAWKAILKLAKRIQEVE